MNGTIYKIISILIFSIFGCSCKQQKQHKKEEQKEYKEQQKDAKQQKNKVITGSVLNLDSLYQISLMDTLYLRFDTKFSENGIKYSKLKDSFPDLLLKKRKLDEETQKRYKKFIREFNLTYYNLYGKINLHKNYRTLVLKNPEDSYLLLNYNSKGELIDFKSFNEYSGMVCSCNPVLYIDPKGIIHGYTETGYPDYSYVWYNVNNKGKFDIVKEYTAPLVEEKEPEGRLVDLFDRTLILDDFFRVLPADLGDDDEHLSKFLEFKTGEVFLNVLFSESSNIKKRKHEEEVKQFDKQIIVYGKYVLENYTVLLSFIKYEDDYCIVSVLNENKEVVDLKLFEASLYPNLITEKKDNIIFYDLDNPISYFISNETGEITKEED